MRPILTFKRFSELPLELAVRLWNDGFEGYFVPINMTVDAFLARTMNEGISLGRSLVAMDDDKPVGFVLNGFRDWDGQKLAWNGGTGVIASHRGMGVGQALIQKTLEVYREEGVTIATLEAIAQNEAAIKLYTSNGYRTIDRLLMLQRVGPFEQYVFGIAETTAYTIEEKLPRDVQSLTFYRGDATWQTMWQSAVNGGQSALAMDPATGEVIGYALYKKAIGESGAPTAIILYQCEAKPGREDARDIAKSLLRFVYSPSEASCSRLTVNLPSRNELVVDLLQQEGFTPQIVQVAMQMKQ